MKYSSAAPLTKEHIFCVIPKDEPKMKVRFIAESSQEAREKALKRWPEAKLLLLESNALH